MLIDVYITWMSIKYARENPSKDPDIFREEMAKFEEEKLQRDEKLVKRFHVEIFHGENYQIAIKRAYYTYLTNYEEFNKEINELTDLNKNIMEFIYAGVKMEELSNDPFDMNQNEAMKLYESLYKNYFLSTDHKNILEEERDFSNNINEIKDD